MDVKSSSIQKLLKFLKHLLDTIDGKQKNWFILNLIDTIKQQGIDAKITDSTILNNINEYCIEEVIKQQAEDFYKKIIYPKKEKEQLISDFIEMEHHRRRNNFEGFCISMFQQMENITNLLFRELLHDLFKNERHIKGLMNETEPNFKSIRLDQLIFFRGNTIPNIKEIEPYFSIIDKPLKFWDFLLRFKVILYYAYFSKFVYSSKQFHNVFFIGKSIYDIRNKIHRVEFNKKIIENSSSFLPEENQNYFKFYGFLHDFINRLSFFIDQNYNSLKPLFDKIDIEDKKENNSNGKKINKTKENQELQEKSNSKSLSKTFSYKESKTPFPKPKDNLLIDFDKSQRPAIADIFWRTISYIGEVDKNQNGLILLYDSPNLIDDINFQCYIDTHNVSDFKGKIVKGEQLYGVNWKAREKRLKELGYLKPENHLFVILTDKKGKIITENNNQIFSSLPPPSAFVPLRRKSKLLQTVTNNDFIDKNTLILTRDPDSNNFTANDYNNAYGTDFNINFDYSEVFTNEVKVIKARFHINKGLNEKDIVKAEKNYLEFISSPPKEIKFSHKTRGIALLQDKEYDISEYLTDNKLSYDEVDLQVSIDGSIVAFGIAYAARTGFTYLIDKKNGRIIQVKPRKLTVEEQNLVVNLLKTYVSKSTIKENGKIDTTGANVLETTDNIELEKGIVETLNSFNWVY
jgi:hypothetical protein